MSITYCPRHHNLYDSDFGDCHYCEDEASEELPQTLGDLIRAAADQAEAKLRKAKQ